MRSTGIGAAVIDGFWLPRRVREEVLSPKTEYSTLSFAEGRPCAPGDEGAVTVRWPRLGQGQWSRLLAALQEDRQQVPRGQAFWDRLRAALASVAQRFADPSDPLSQQALAALPSYTGYSKPMIGFSLSALDLMALHELPAAFALSPTRRVARGWQSMPGLSGRLRFYASRPWQRAFCRLPLGAERPLFGTPSLPDLAVGYGAGNVPGTALLIAFLAQAVTLAGGAPPAVLVRNSRREPIFSPLVFEGLEEKDPDLVSAIAILVWEYEDTAVQELLLSRADITIAAASDESIEQIGRQLVQAREGATAPVSTADASRSVRFHAHGHKVSFSAVGREVLIRGLADPASGQSLLDIVALLAALDSALWDQHGCLSSRIHFVERGAGDVHTSKEYAERLVEQLRLLALYLPRGAWPLGQLQDRFDKYKLLEAAGQVQVMTEYDDEFLVVVDERPLDAAILARTVNDCQGRVVIVRAVDDLMDVPNRYLRLLPARNLQSLSVAVGPPGEGLTDDILRFAGACGACGVTAIRTVGRGAFPQLAYSWDGLIPLDMVRRRPAGHFTTIEFDACFEQMIETYHLLLRRGAGLGSARVGA